MQRLVAFNKAMYTSGVQAWLLTGAELVFPALDCRLYIYLYLYLNPGLQIYVYLLILYHIVMLSNIISYYQIIEYYIISYHIIQCNKILYYITLYFIILCYIVSNQIIPVILYTI